ncbi:hypothetical protein A2118_03280 [Candidatus Kaiserbacteria bacterium GWA2_50_9]|uniref:Uncharacterized protein n=1 Tax=Candidatus Kaiserbacteria bacterium GWA2_50_9 TaxID=1798474 RepID=A0A1F6BSA1_9BACT|nr:MAG: hypothetical protein A2118_03280 [Candidatus Kaiserbacteria bacterium GWA2_50_9]
MNILLKWNTRLAIIAVVASIVGYFFSVLAVDVDVADAILARLVVACAASALASGVVAVCGYLLDDGEEFDSTSHSEHEVMWYLGLAYTALSLAALLSVPSYDSGMPFVLVYIVVALCALALLFTDAAARAPRHLYLQESHSVRFVLALAFIGPLAGKVWRR